MANIKTIQLDDTPIAKIMYLVIIRDMNLSTNFRDYNKVHSIWNTREEAEDIRNTLLQDVIEINRVSISILKIPIETQLERNVSANPFNFRNWTEIL